MTDAAPSSATTAAPARPKKSYFKKADWQKQPEDNGNIFMHSEEYIQMRAADEERIRREKREKEQEERKRKEEERKRKAEEKHDRKRRKISLEEDDLKHITRSSSSTTRSGRKEDKERSRTPGSPVPNQNDHSSLGARYNSLTESSSALSNPHQSSEVIDIDDSGTDSEDTPFKAAKSSSFVESRLPTSRAKPTPTEEPEEIEDPLLAQLAARARARAANRTAPSTSANSALKNDPTVQVFISSDIPETKAMLIKVRVSMTLEKIRHAWCASQGFDKEMTRDIFLTWKHNKVFDSTTVKRLGIKVDDNGGITVENAAEMYDEDNLPKVHIEAWTAELFAKHNKYQAEETARKQRELESTPPVEEEPIAVPEPPTSKTRLILKAKGKPDFKIMVKQDTTIEYLTSAYKTNRGIPEDEPVTLMFDGERLRPMDTIGDTEIEDLDVIEVRLK